MKGGKRWRQACSDSYNATRNSERSIPMSICQKARVEYTPFLRKTNVRGKDRFDVVYIGMARGNSGVRGRLRTHSRSKRKGKLWTHFSVFEVWNNITDGEIAELEGLFRHIYRKDTQANGVNKQRSFRKMTPLRNNRLKSWRDISPGVTTARARLQADLSSTARLPPGVALAFPKLLQPRLRSECGDGW